VLQDAVLEVAQDENRGVVLLDDRLLVGADLRGPAALASREAHDHGDRSQPPELLGDVAGGMGHVVAAEGRSHHGDLGPGQRHVDDLAPELAGLGLDGRALLLRDGHRHQDLDLDLGLLDDEASDVLDQLVELVHAVNAAVVHQDLVHHSASFTLISLCTALAISIHRGSMSCSVPMIVIARSSTML